MKTLNLYILHSDTARGITPEFKTEHAACADVFLPERVTIPPKTAVKINLLISLDIADGYKVVMYPRSSTLFKGIIQPTSIIDSDYRGPIHVPMYNYTDNELTFEAGECVSQIEVQKTYEVEDFNRKFVRRTGGFGSTDAANV